MSKYDLKREFRVAYTLEAIDSNLFKKKKKSFGKRLKWVVLESDADRGDNYYIRARFWPIEGIQWNI